MAASAVVISRTVSKTAEALYIFIICLDSSACKNLIGGKYR